MRNVESIVDDPRIDLSTPAVARVIALLDAHAAAITQSAQAVPEGDLVVRWVTVEASASLHEQFFNDSAATDVMTFPGEPEDLHAGDLAICPAIAQRAAPEHGTTFAEELTLYLVHGWLHLAGLDDRDEVTRAAMRAAEGRALALLQAEAALLPVDGGQKDATGA